jgi:hypothetical protein
MTMANVSNPMKTKSEEGQGFPGQQTAAAATDRAKEAATYVGDKAKSMASSAMHSAEDAAGYVGQKAGDATTAVGGSLKSLGSTIRESTPSDSMVSSASCAVADSLESAGRYIEEEGLSGISEDMTNMIRRNPIPALLIGVGVGFLIARAMTPSRTY